MAYNLNVENIIIHDKTCDMPPSISSTILHVRYIEHANSKSVQSFPIWRYVFAIRSSDIDSTGLWPPGSLHTLGTDGHI